MTALYTDDIALINPHGVISLVVFPLQPPLSSEIGESKSMRQIEWFETIDGLP